MRVVKEMRQREGNKSWVEKDFSIKVLEWNLDTREYKLANE